MKYGIQEGMMSKESGTYVGTSKPTLTKKTKIDDDDILQNLKKELFKRYFSNNINIGKICLKVF